MRAGFPLLLTLALAACSEPTADQTSAKEAILAVNAAYDRALLDGDATALDRFYHDDFRIVDGTGEVHDKQNQIQFMTQSIDLLQGKGEDLQLEMLGPDAALLTGRFVARYRMDGKEAESNQRFTAVYVREGDNWQIRHEHVSTVPRPDEQATSG